MIESLKELERRARVEMIQQSNETFLKVQKTMQKDFDQSLGNEAKLRKELTNENNKIKGELKEKHEEISRVTAEVS